MNESDTPSHHRLLKAARRTTRAEVTLVTIVTIITLWSFYALYKLSIGGSDSILGLSGSLKSKNSISGLQEQPLAHAELGASSQTFSQAGSPSKFHDDQRDRKRSEFQQEVESKFREQLIRDILTKQRELYGSWPGTLNMNGQPMLPREVDLRRPLPPMWLNGRGNSTQYYNPLNKSLVSVREHIRHTPINNRGPQMKSSKSESTRTASKTPFIGSTARSFNSKATGDTDRDVDESISIDRTVVTTQVPPINSEQATNDLDNRLEDSYEDDGNESGSKLEPPESNHEDESDGQQVGIEPNDQKDSNESDAESIKNSTDESNDNETSDRSSEEQKSGPVDEASIERARKASTSIDEEVDRMTQPSLDNASQQSVNDSISDGRLIRAQLKGAVQFDDTIGGSLNDQEHTKLPKPIEPGRLIAHFIAPNSNELAKNQLKNAKRRVATPKRGRERLENKEDSRDLLIDHNQPPEVTSALANEPYSVQVDNMKRKLMGTEAKNGKYLENNHPKRTGRMENLVRSRRSLVRYPGNNETRNKSSKSNSGKRSRKLSIKRADSNDSVDEQEDDDDDDDHDENHNTALDKVQLGEVEKNPRPEIDAVYENYTAPIATDVSIQDLLAHKRLLDELDKSRLPAPHYSVPNEHLHPQPVNQTGNNNHLASASVPVDTSRPVKSATDSTYDTVHSTQTETEIEDSARKSMLKKGSKNADTRAKNKMMEALNKGGSKSKKHNVEEKKYLKEKKFRGAKSGEKTAKGKGGKGGKKGTKFYKDRGFKKKGFKNIYVKNEFGQKKSYFDEFRDKDFKKKWKNFDDKYNYAQMKKWHTKDIKGAKKMKDEGEKSKDYDRSRWKKKFHAKQASEASKKKKKYDEFKK